MAWQGRTVLAVVPARGGSKGVPRKNIAEVGGLSLIARAAAVIKALPWIDRALITTDDPEFAAEARRHGLDAPFLRPPELATDTAIAVEVWIHAWLAAEAQHGMRFDTALYLQPTSPFRTPAHVEATLRAMLEGGHAAACTVSRVPGHFTPPKLLLRDEAGVIAPFSPDARLHKNRQTIPPYWYRNGYCYAALRRTVVDQRQIDEADCVGVPVDGPIVNIDDPFELQVARWMASQGGV
ncbi:acylneuraminate cytidylyltransferase family protein [Vineibacter terrae]|uniref:Acylneuraminate cytidylyltransferase family protein n=1 Tax=Vineibacter terrae TaxID=2586908 RepID=A0A5C8PL44_9HYPH|nr:acylneuraminate cytidylyltransferase family protein [Vineibacter terrae]TXL74430.1 acylneuraminate cytidylyltransferase family protein [Vineibacter terrae]